jgi:hypothetical protein
MTEEKVLCQGVNLDGRECTRHRTPGEETCWWHRPEKVEERARALEEQAARLRGKLAAAK